MERANQKEFYHYGFQELCQAIGEQAAREKVQMYQQLSSQYQSCPNWIIHNCLLLRSYRDPSIEKVSTDSCNYSHNIGCRSKNECMEDQFTNAYFESFYAWLNQGEEVQH